MKITIYELLGLVKENKAPKKIKYIDKIFTFDGKRYCSYDKTKVWLDLEGLLSTYISEDTLNDTVGILEEKKLPEKLEGINSLFKIEQDLDLKGFLAWQKANNKMIENKINSIIDYLKSKGDE